jgi:hypothetical protein
MRRSCHRKVVRIWRTASGRAAVKSAMPLSQGRKGRLFHVEQRREVVRFWRAPIASLDHYGLLETSLCPIRLVHSARF